MNVEKGVFHKKNQSVDIASRAERGRRDWGLFPDYRTPIEEISKTEVNKKIDLKHKFLKVNIQKKIAKARKLKIS